MAESRENEILRNTGTWLSDISVAIIQAGVVLPILNQILNVSPLSGPVLTLLIGSCLVVAGGLHSMSHLVLEGIE